MSHSFVDQMLDKTRAGELRSPVSSTLGMHPFASTGIRVTFDAASYVGEQEAE